MKDIRPFLSGISLAFILTGWLLFQAYLAWVVDPHGPGLIGPMFGVFAGLVVLGIPLLIFWGGFMWWKRGRLPGRVHALMFLPPLAALLAVPAAIMISVMRGPDASSQAPAGGEKPGITSPATNP
ncbi:hypothetical protein GAO09_06195 [Rhizobiales bacterium RZME27]|jgi:uncharacterized iron-regulated membrane protein|uniref:Uncharacterized protein n=1 Tax=Endobacterium cereale TaxID=2663029 RepID=A0A6A8AA13_9HYPH|nr:hypothetical protein [Endobacterium cereale]MEB2846214.1 hypothetical protein [Endobacterium cereale]MQY45651.1 hypothetical protein [Endobacterium cereale]